MLGIVTVEIRLGEGQDGFEEDETNGRIDCLCRCSVAGDA